MAGKDPKRQRMEYIAIGLLVLVAGFIGISRFKKKDVDDEVFSRKKFNEEWKKVEILVSEIPQGEKGVSYNLDPNMTPFKSPVEDKKKIEATEEDIILPSMTFQGMVWNTKRPQVIINNNVYDVNDVIDMETEGYKVKIEDITKDGVALRYKGRDFLVRPK